MQIFWCAAARAAGSSNMGRLRSDEWGDFCVGLSDGSVIWKIFSTYEVLETRRKQSFMLKILIDYKKSSPKLTQFTVTPTPRILSLLQIKVTDRQWKPFMRDQHLWPWQ